MRKYNLLLIYFFIFILNISSPTGLCQEGTINFENTQDFFKQNSDELLKQQYRFNKYENIISGGIGLSIGMIGQFSTDSSILKIVYAGVQTLGVITIGHGYYLLKAPVLEQSISELTNTIGSSHKSSDEIAVEFSDQMLSYFAQKDKAFRHSVVITSSLLSFQYFFNAFVDRPTKDLKNIYIYLGGINIMLAVYNLIDPSRNELMNDKIQIKNIQRKEFQVQIIPSLFNVNETKNISSNFLLGPSLLINF